MPLAELNRRTQPPQRFRLFNRTKVIPRAWFFAFRSSDVPAGRVRPLQIGDQRLVVFRGSDGKPTVLDAFCPHMGTDLALGRVVGDSIRCHFHHWRFAADGRCVDIPCQPSIPEAARTRSYACCERYGAIWVFPDSVPDFPMFEIPGLEGKPTDADFDAPNPSRSPYHVSMVNGLDAQHLRTVHGLGIDMKVRIEEGQGHIDFVLAGPVPSGSWSGRMTRFLLGPNYSYAMRYAGSTVAALVLMRGVHFLRPNWIWPELYMIFAYRPLPDGGSMTQPIFVAERRAGLFGWLRSFVLRRAVRVAYHFLEEDDQRIYDNIRFQTRNLLSIDGAVARYVRFVEGLTPSEWSSEPADGEPR
jgi:phenylpropionate dioxygenase-like ring-hydroxylating dioxygenase large terminal subunit